MDGEKPKLFTASDARLMMPRHQMAAMIGNVEAAIRYAASKDKSAVSVDFLGSVKGESFVFSPTGLAVKKHFEVAGFTFHQTREVLDGGHFVDIGMEVRWEAEK